MQDFKTKCIFTIPNTSLQRTILPSMPFISNANRSVCSDKKDHFMRPMRKMEKGQMKTLIRAEQKLLRKVLHNLRARAHAQVQFADLS